MSTAIHPLMSSEELADYLGTTTQRLATHRMKGTGPRFVKEGRRVLYRRAEVEAWLDSNTRERTTGEGS
jgi:predicted DNA-binding transcriptional regulator AlpA